MTLKSNDVLSRWPRRRLNCTRLWTLYNVLHVTVTIQWHVPTNWWVVNVLISCLPNQVVKHFFIAERNSLPSPFTVPLSCGILQQIGTLPDCNIPELDLFPESKWRQFPILPILFDHIPFHLLNSIVAHMPLSWQALYRCYGGTFPASTILCLLLISMLNVCSH